MSEELDRHWSRIGPFESEWRPELADLLLRFFPRGCETPRAGYAPCWFQHCEDKAHRPAQDGQAESPRHHEEALHPIRDRRLQSLRRAPWHLEARNEYSS